MQPFDCELLRAGWPTQPVNTVSALAFLVVGASLWRRGFRLPGLAATAVGIGSVAFHGSPGPVASWLHDIGLYGLVAVAALRVWRLTAVGRPPVLPLVVFFGGVVIWAFSRTGGPWCDPRSLIQGHAIWHVVAAVTVELLYRTPSTAHTPATEP